MDEKLKAAITILESANWQFTPEYDEASLTMPDWKGMSVVFVKQADDDLVAFISRIIAYQGVINSLKLMALLKGLNK